MDPLILMPAILVSFVIGFGLSKVIMIFRHHAGYMLLGYDEDDKQAVYKLVMEKHPYKVAKSKFIILDIKIGEFHREKDMSYYEDERRS